MNLPIALRRTGLAITGRAWLRYEIVVSPSSRSFYRGFRDDGRNRLSNFWIPTGGVAKKEQAEDAGKEDSHDLLIRGGFIRQAHSGIFQLLPLGLRVQEKIEGLIDKHMRKLGASKLSLSTFSSEELWQRSGRLQGDKAELFRLEDRKGSKFLLSPTHEEEITSLVADIVHSHHELPLRLYQITRKYRDELRPRQGLLRTREFLMKDLYTFDATQAQALATYETVRAAYSAFFNELKVPYRVCEADSGSIGGDLSHEYHILSPKGEDDVLVCSSCDFAANREVAPVSPAPPAPEAETEGAADSALKCTRCGTGTLTSSKAIELGHTFYLGTKYSAPLSALVTTDSSSSSSLSSSSSQTPPSHRQPQPQPQPHPQTILDTTTPSVVGQGHTVPIEMGCHGIGISRLIAGVADHLSDTQGLNWPTVIAPFEAIIIPAKGVADSDATEVLDTLVLTTNGKKVIDGIIDDRPSKDLIWKLKDADLIGYPVVVVLGRAWKGKASKSPKRCEVQCRRLDYREEVELEALGETVRGLLDRL